MQRLIRCLLLLGATLAGCGPARPDLATERAAIHARDREWLAAAGAGDVERTVSYWTDDAVVYPPGGPAVVGKAALRRMVSETARIPGFRVSWHTDSIVVSAAGDLAYATGTNAFTVNDSAGRPVTTVGRVLGVWRKDPDGVWRCAAELWNGGPPAPPPNGP
jgi:ketosteroid isomerase-like protein